VDAVLASIDKELDWARGHERGGHSREENRLSGDSREGCKEGLRKLLDLPASDCWRGLHGHVMRALFSRPVFEWMDGFLPQGRGNGVVSGVQVPLSVQGLRVS
jgi:hypothetical protein